MVTKRVSIDTPLEQRYKTSHVGGSFDAKNLPKVKPSKEKSNKSKNAGISIPKEIKNVGNVRYRIPNLKGRRLPEIIFTGRKPAEDPPAPFVPIIPDIENSNIVDSLIWDTDENNWDADLNGNLNWDTL